MRHHVHIYTAACSLQVGPLLEPHACPVAETKQHCSSPAPFQRSGAPWAAGCGRAARAPLPRGHVGHAARGRAEPLARRRPAGAPRGARPACRGTCACAAQGASAAGWAARPLPHTPEHRALASPPELRCPEACPPSWMIKRTRVSATCGSSRRRLAQGCAACTLLACRHALRFPPARCMQLAA
jgi:hypothetical protein